MPVHTHLTAEARVIADLDDARRIAHLTEDHWIDYPRARQALQELERLLGCPERTRMPGLLLHGESNIGKSMVIQKFLRAHPAREFNTDTGLLQVDVLAVEMPSAPQERRLYGQLLMALNAPYRPGDRLAAVEYTALMLLRKVAPRMIVVDEVHNLLAGSAHEQRASLNLLKFLPTSSSARSSCSARATRWRRCRPTPRSPAASRASSFHGGRRTKTSGVSWPGSSGSCRCGSHLGSLAAAPWSARS